VHNQCPRAQETRCKASSEPTTIPAPTLMHPMNNSLSYPLEQTSIASLLLFSFTKTIRPFTSWTVPYQPQTYHQRLRCILLCSPTRVSVSPQPLFAAPV